ncbi:uncharacterized protein MYCFIDRAFT_87218 [Pseudocercospora fijiensis CIRAD86]|uniref:Uncharacterized protein n=1 Tax=Pseudocercospora fijiensis (strain CIRAD86) TaxID=383855 RepID=M3A0C1_PSEFD|nr:uncharacterized protein MYCFIDRAFT_87218 [Pseudocercospora fijiensis CIRAD86]EME77851.1 hypothetical protein MYCFIDRAFT_87218 [Pseudocercospora fijiensis CIRAD86]
MPLSEKQMKYLALAWQCFDTEPKIDYEKFAQVAGLKTSASARELMRVTKNKLKEEYGALSGDVQMTNGGTPGKKRATPSKRKAGTGSGDDEEEQETVTPASKKKKKVKKSPTKALPPVVKSEPTPDDSEEDGLGLL